MKSDCNLWYALIPRIHVIVAPVRKMFSLANQGVTFYTLPPLMSLFRNPVLQKQYFFLQIQQSMEACLFNKFYLLVFSFLQICPR